MREKTVQIHFRASEKERREFQHNAMKCGLSLSAYFRMLGNRHEPKSLPPLQYGKLVEILSNLYSLFQQRNNPETAEDILYLVKKLTEAISPSKAGGQNGNNQDLACS